MNIKTTSFMILIGLFISTQSIWAETLVDTGCPLPLKVTQSDDIEGGPITKTNIYRRSYDEAECLRRAAAAEGAEWLETESLLLRSRDEADRGNWETASRLVQKAHFQAERALQQAEQEAETWKHRVVD